MRLCYNLSKFQILTSINPQILFIIVRPTPVRSKVSKNLGERSEPFNVGYTIFLEIRTRSFYALSETAPLRTFGTP